MLWPSLISRLIFCINECFEKDWGAGYKDESGVLCSVCVCVCTCKLKKKYFMNRDFDDDYDEVQGIGFFPYDMGFFVHCISIHSMLNITVIFTC